MESFFFLFCKMSVETRSSVFFFFKVVHTKTVLISMSLLIHLLLRVIFTNNKKCPSTIPVLETYLKKSTFVVQERECEVVVIYCLRQKSRSQWLLRSISIHTNAADHRDFPEKKAFYRTYMPFPISLMFYNVIKVLFLNEVHDHSRY